MVSRATALSPISRIAAGDGPMKVTFAWWHMVANRAFSARKPKPGWTAWQSVFSAAARIASMSR